MKRKPEPPPSAGELRVAKQWADEPSEQTRIWIEVLKIAAEHRIAVSSFHSDLLVAVEEIEATRMTAELALQFLYKVKGRELEKLFKRRRKTCLRLIRKHAPAKADNVVNLLPHMRLRPDDDEPPAA